MSITSALYAAKSGLEVNGRKAEIVANNVANASTPGYVKRSLVVGEFMSGSDMSGAIALGVSRAGDERVAAQRRDMSSDLAQATVLSSTWQAISRKVGDSVSGGGLFSAFSRFETGLSEAIASPESATTLSALFDAARLLSSELNSMAAYAVQARAEADQEINDGVSNVNAALSRIQDINTRISRAEENSALAAALMDERGRLVDEVAQFLPVDAIRRTSGTVDIVTREGVYLINGGTLRQIEFTPAPAFTPDKTLASGDLSGISIEGVDLTPGAASFGAISAGQFGALFTLRDQDLPAFIDQLDMVAQDLITRLSADSIDPTKTPGAFGLFVDPQNAGQLGLASRIALNPAVDPAQGGDTRRLRDGLGSAGPGPPGNSAILRAIFSALTEVKAVSANGIRGNFSSAGLAAELSSVTGRKRIYEESIQASTQTQYLAMVEAEQRETSVDIDKEMESLLLIEQAYAANARVIQIAGEMLNMLMEI